MRTWSSGGRLAGWVAVLVLAWLALQLVATPRTVMMSWSLPDRDHYYSYHPDEIFLLLPSFYLAHGDWNPHFFNYGTLYIHLVGIQAILSHVVPDAAAFPSNLRPLYQLGRNTTSLMGVATAVLLVLLFWRKERWGGPLAALLLGICPLHVVNSGYATADVPATFFVTLAFVLALRGADRPTAKWGLLVGLAVGLAAATKYSMGLFIVPALLAPDIIPPRDWRWSWYGGIVAGAVLGFTIGCPFFWTEEFRRDFLFELHHARIGGTLAFVGTGNGWAYHLLHGVPVGLGYPLLAAVVLGLIATIRNHSRPTRLALFWIVFYLLVIGFGKERFIRYLVPLTPFLCLLAASGLVWLHGLSRHVLARGATVAVGIAVVALTGGFVGEYAGTFVRGDPRDRAWAELREVVMGPLANYRVGLVEAPWFSDPPVSPHNAGPFSRPMFEQWNRHNGDRVVITGWDADKLRAENPDIFFLSDLESQDLLRLKRPHAVSFVAALEKLYKGRRVFARKSSLSWLAPPRSWAPPDWLYPDPHITMYYTPRPKEP